MTEGIYKKCAAPKRKGWPKFHQTLRSLSIPTSTWASELSDHIVLLKLGFASKRQHDPKGIVDFHLKQNHFKPRYNHEVLDEFIYQGVDIFFEVLVRTKSKEQQNQILLYQKEFRDRVQHYREMELDIQEKMIRDREEKEAQEIAKEAKAAKDPSIATSSATDKGKIPMGDIPHAYFDQQVKALIHTSEKIKQKMTRMNSALDTQEIGTSQTVEDTQVTAVANKSQSKQNQVE